jgi:tRNA threonylcarbamoyladenosine biosynthesis protein TsaB
MRVLALDTTTRTLSAALVEDDHVLAQRVGDLTRSHAERLPADLLAVTLEAGIELGSVDVFAVAAGPGSFTGLRIGIATMQGLAFVLHRRIVAVSALDALAHVAAADAAPDAIIGAWIDARRRDVFSALYRVVAAPPFTRARLQAVETAAVGDPTTILTRWAASGQNPHLLVGSGAHAYGDVIQAAGGSQIVEAPPLAPAIGLMAVERAAAGEAVDPAAVQPLYVRRPDAVIAREQNAKRFGEPS